MKMLKLVLLICTCVTLSMAYYKPRLRGMAQAASPRSGYRHPVQNSFAVAAQPDVPPAFLEQLQQCANQQCPTGRHTLLCRNVTLRF